MEDSQLAELVYRASQLLLYPTLVLLTLGFLQMLWLLGEAMQDAWSGRHCNHLKAVRQLRDICLDDAGSLEPALTVLGGSPSQHPQVRGFVRSLLAELDYGPRSTLPARIEHLVGRTEAALAKDVNRSRVLVRLGPLLGLIGTLLPLGPGLMALHEGDLSRLSGQLVVAFSTTVVGLLIGGISYAIALARAHAADMVADDVELVAESVQALLDVQAADTPPTRWRRPDHQEALR